MINKVTFTGREDMLTKGLKTVTKRYEYVNAGKVYSQAEKDTAKKLLENLNKIDNAQNNDFAKLNMAYAVSHGTPAKEVPACFSRIA